MDFSRAKGCASGHRHAQWVGAQHFKLDACGLVAGGWDHDREFQRGISQSGNEFIAGEVMQQHLDAGHGFLKRGECRRQYLHRGGRRVADVQLAIFAASQRADFFHGFVGALQQVAHFIQKELSLRGERDAAWTAMQEVHADLILQVLHLPAQCRLPDSKLRRSLGEVQRFTYG